MSRKPEIDDASVFLWNAFWSLSGDRPIERPTMSLAGMSGPMASGGGIGPIPFLSIDRYAERYGVDGRDEFQRFHAIIRRLDGAFLKLANKQSGA